MSWTTRHDSATTSIRLNQRGLRRLMPNTTSSGRLGAPFMFDRYPTRWTRNTATRRCRSDARCELSLAAQRLSRHGATGPNGPRWRGDGLVPSAVRPLHRHLQRPDPARRCAGYADATTSGEGGRAGVGGRGSPGLEGIAGGDGSGWGIDARPTTALSRIPMLIASQCPRSASMKPGHITKPGQLMFGFHVARITVRSTPSFWKEPIAPDASKPGAIVASDNPQE